MIKRLWQRERPPQPDVGTVTAVYADGTVDLLVGGRAEPFSRLGLSDPRAAYRVGDSALLAFQYGSHQLPFIFASSRVGNSSTYDVQSGGKPKQAAPMLVQLTDWAVAAGQGARGRANPAPTLATCSSSTLTQAGFVPSRVFGYASRELVLYGSLSSTPAWVIVTAGAAGWGTTYSNAGAISGYAVHWQAPRPTQVMLDSSGGMLTGQYGLGTT